MSDGTLDDRYLSWLYEQVADPNNTPTYWKVLKVLFTTEFVWIVQNDDNRIQDGKAIRLKFLYETGIDGADPEWVELGCSVLELMVGLSERLAFIADGEPHYWFWVLMENLGLARYNDRHRIPRREIEDILTRVIFRQYEPNGHGGFFPLENTEKDQREVELWSQLNEYVTEADSSVH